MAVYGIIPARLQSTRLPRKLLLSETGKPLIQYAWEAAQTAQTLDEVVIATDSEELAGVAGQFGARAELTGDHPSGTDRIAEVVKKTCSDAEIVVNIQGDEPEISPDALDALVQTLRTAENCEMATLATPIHNLAMLDDRSCTKVVCAANGRALYFSRLPIPFCRDQQPEEVIHHNSPWLLHLGVYAYRKDFLIELAAQPPSKLEQLEKLEQLRALELGAGIQVAIIDEASVGIDTPEDYARFVERQMI